MSAGKQVIFSSKGSKPIGPYSQAIKAGNTLYLSGNIGCIPETGLFAGEDIDSQTEQVMKNINIIIDEAGLKMENIVKSTILLRDMKDFPNVNAIYGKYFPLDPPARSTFAVAGLPKNALVEIECIAYYPN